mgnify:CR=1 FL=1
MQVDGKVLMHRRHMLRLQQSNLCSQWRPEAQKGIHQHRIHGHSTGSRSRTLQVLQEAMLIVQASLPLSTRPVGQVRWEATKVLHFRLLSPGWGPRTMKSVGAFLARKMTQFRFSKPRPPTTKTGEIESLIIAASQTVSGEFFLTRRRDKTAHLHSRR